MTELAVGAPFDDDGGFERGAVWILFLNQDGTVRTEQKISAIAGGFQGTLEQLDLFGASVAGLGDLDGDGVADLAVGAPLDDDGGFNRGAVWVLFLNQDGTVRSERRISAISGGFQGMLDDDDLFGSSVASLGDLDGDGVTELAVGAQLDDDGNLSVDRNETGAAWVLFLDQDGMVRAEQKISATAGGFQGALDDFDEFGSSVASLGDLDRDGVVDLAVGAPGDDDGGSSWGAVWMLFLNQDGTVRAEQKISATAGGFQGALDDLDEFGSSVASLGDLDRNGVVDLAVGTPQDDDGGPDRGAAWLLFLKQDGTVGAKQKISDTVGAFQGTLEDGDVFGFSVTSLGDFDENGVADFATGAFGDQDGGCCSRGAVWVLFLENRLMLSR